MAKDESREMNQEEQDTWDRMNDEVDSLAAQQGQPDTLLGRPVIVDPNMPSMEAGAKSILFGDFSGYYIRDVGSIRIERSNDFKFDTDVVTFRTIMRTDGDLIDANCVKAYQNSAT